MQVFEIYPKSPPNFIAITNKLTLFMSTLKIAHSISFS